MSRRRQKRASLRFQFQLTPFRRQGRKLWPPHPKTPRLRIEAVLAVHALPKHTRFEHFSVKIPALRLQRIDMKIGREHVRGTTGFGLSRESGPPP